MKKITTVLLVLILSLVLTACTEDEPTISSDFIVRKIDFFIENNTIVDELFDNDLEDVPTSIVYQRSDFIYYNQKDTNNVDIEYDEYYDAFSQLYFVKQVLLQIEEFETGKTYTNTVQREEVIVQYIDDVLMIDYYEAIVDLDVVMYHHYDLAIVNEKPVMTKYLKIYDLELDEEILQKKYEVCGYDTFLIEEFYPQTDAFNYEYTSYQDQEYFYYKGSFDNEGSYLRQTVEAYVPSHSAFISYDIKEAALEDYRVKFFEEGHRVLKADINIKNSNPTISELTWNLLSIDNWSSVENFDDVYFVYIGNFQTLIDYDISVQLGGYGKVVAYKLIEGDLVNSDVTLEDYDLDSGYTLEDIEQARQYFEDNYVGIAESYGFTVNAVGNRAVVYDDINLYEDSLEAYAARFK